MRTPVNTTAGDWVETAFAVVAMIGCLGVFAAVAFLLIAFGIWLMG